MQSAKKDKYVLETQKTDLWRKQTQFKDMSWNQSPEEVEKYQCDNYKSTDTVSPYFEVSVIYAQTEMLLKKYIIKRWGVEKDYPTQAAKKA